jgi:hypothetical protein
MAKKQTKIRTFEGLPVVDADKDIDIHITPKDIQGSKKKNPAMCAAARAGQRELGTEVRVFLTRTYVKQKNHWVRFLTPHRTTKEIVSFDRGASFEPGEYYFKAPSPGQKLGQHRGTNTTKGSSKRKMRQYSGTGNVRERGKYDSTTANLVKGKKK